MGTSIGQTPAAIARLDSVTVRRRARSGGERLSGQGGNGRSEEPEARAGFGAGTLSAQGAALKTVSTNLRRARELVPTVEELQAQARIAAKEAAAKLEAANAARETVPDGAPLPETPTLVTALPKAEPLARLFAEERPEATVRVAPSNPEPPQAVASAVASRADARDGASALLDVLA